MVGEAIAKRRGHGSRSGATERGEGPREKKCELRIKATGRV